MKKPRQPKRNTTGLPDQLKAGVESLSGQSLDEVRVHYNSAKPAQLEALAYAQGTDIHVAPGPEQHLPHEAWHVVQQQQGRVKPTEQLAGLKVNDDAALERAADDMGAKAAHLPTNTSLAPDASQ
ncbi:eCIS core domain-containing protein [Hymenobacter ruber]